MLIQKLKNSNYLHKTTLGGGLPYKVIKLTDRGVRQYYNQLVLKRGVDNPTWWLHHLNQLEDNLQSPVLTGGETLVFSGRLYLSQAPGFVEPDQRVKDEKTIHLENFDDMEGGEAIMLHNVRVNPQNGVTLDKTDETEIKKTAVGDLRGSLTHFPVIQDKTEQNNPFLLKGKLIEFSGDKIPGQLLLTFANPEGNQVKLQLQEEEAPEQIGEKVGEKFCFGPVQEVDEEYDDDTFHLQLRTGGEIRPVSPTFPE